MGIILTNTGLPLITAGKMPAAPTPAPPPVVVPEVGKVDWTHQGYAGLKLILDFSDTLSTAITDVSPSIPYEVDDRTLTLTPNAVAAETTYTVTAGSESNTFDLVVSAPPPRLAVVGTPQSFVVERGRPLPACPLEMHVEGTGIPPYTYEQAAGPSWIETVAGQHKGIAPDAVMAEAMLTARVTDKRGDVVDITRTVEVVDTYSRTPTHTLPAATTVMSYIASQGLGSGDVLYIPKARSPVTWGTGSAVSIAWDAPPLIIIGDTYVADDDETVIVAGVDLSAWSGVILEKLTFVHTTDPGGGIDFTVKLGERVWAYECRHRGYRLTIDPDVGDWQNEETFTHNGEGPQVQLYAVVHNNVIDEIEESLFFHGHSSGYGGAAYNTEILRYTDDGMILNEIKSICISGLKMNGPTGNYTSGQHQDFIQFYGNNPPAPRNVLIEDFELSSDGAPMQGILTDHDGWGVWATSPAHMFNNVVIRNGFCFNGVWLTIALTRCYNVLLENCIFLLHPNANIGTYFSTIRTWDGCLATIRNCIFERIDNAGITNFPHLFTLENNIDLPRLVSPTQAEYLAIFPNWDNDALPPLERFAYDYSWRLSHPDIGPTLLSAEPPDATAPVLQHTIPADNATGVSISAQTSAVYNETLVAGTGSFTLRNITAGADVQSIAVGNAAVSIVGETVTIDWTADFVNGAEYQITAPAGILEDVAGNPVAAIASGAWSFTTASASTFTGLTSGSTITYRGVDFNFFTTSGGATEATVHWLTSANGDPVLITDATRLPSTVYMEMDPPSQEDSAGFWMHGAEMDPVDQETYIQGFDEGFRTGGGAKSGQMRPYSEALNVDPGATGSRIPIGQGDAFCLVKSLRDPTKIPYDSSTIDDYKLVYRYVTLAAMPSLPPRAGTWFRPGISAPTKAWPRLPVEEIDFDTDASIFRHLPRPSGLIQPATALTAVQNGSEITIPFWNDTGERGRRMMLSQAAGTYAEHVGSRRGEYCCALHTDNRSSPTEQAARETLATIVIQWGIDNDGAHQSGQTHSNGAGQHSGYLPYHYIAAFALGDPDMLDRAQHHMSNMVGQLFWVVEDMIGFPISTTGHTNNIQETYQIEHLGMPEWNSEGWQKYDINKLDVLHPEAAGEETKIGDGWTKLSASLWMAYRSNNFTPLLYEVMSVALLRNGTSGLTGDAAMRRGGEPNDPGHLGGANLAHLDRQMYWRPWRISGVAGPGAGGGRGWPMYQLWRDHVPAPRWTGQPDMESGIDSQMRVFWPGASSGTIDWDIAGRALSVQWTNWYYSTLPILESQISYSLDGVWWSAPVSVGVDRKWTLTGLRPQTMHWLRWRHRNSAGWSIWSPSWEQNDGATHMRNRTNSAGTVSGTFANSVAPALMYQPYPEYPRMPYYAPVSNLSTDPVYGPNDPSTEILFAGIGYWTGGTAANVVTSGFGTGDILNSISRAWQRNTGGGWSGTIGTGLSFNISGESSGTQIRCVVTVRTVSATSNAVTIP